MNFQDYVDRAAATDDLGTDEEAIRIGLFGIAGESGEVVSEAKKFFRDGGPLPGLEDRISEELGDLLWYMALLARRLGLDLGDIAQQNLDKTGALWSSTMPPPPDYDDHLYDSQKLLRHMTVEFEEDRSGGIPVVRMIPKGVVSGGREPPPPALSEPYVTVSRHTAPTVRRSSASVDLSAPPPRG